MAFSSLTTSFIKDMKRSRFSYSSTTSRNAGGIGIII